MIFVKCIDPLMIFSPATIVVSLTDQSMEFGTAIGHVQETRGIDRWYFIFTKQQVYVLFAHKERNYHLAEWLLYIVILLLLSRAFPEGIHNCRTAICTQSQKPTTGNPSHDRWCVSCLLNRVLGFLLHKTKKNHWNINSTTIILSYGKKSKNET
jgi:hypothetical protein